VIAARNSGAIFLLAVSKVGRILFGTNMDVVEACTETQGASCCVDMNQRLDRRVPMYQNTRNTSLQGRAAQEGE